MTKEKFLLIDGHAIIHRAYHAYPPTLTTQSGEQVNAVYGFTSILLEVLNKFKPKYVICAFDTHGPTQRHDLFIEYKQNRSKPEDELLQQIPRILEVVEAFSIPIFKLQGFEADDILGTIVTEERTEDIQKIIVTGDQDIFQLIDEQVRVYMSGTKFSKSKLYDADGVIEKFGFGPDYIVDYKALRGDPSDNIPGVKGIGDKGAKTLIGEYGHLDGILEHADEVKSKSMKNKLLNGGEMAELSRQLATIIKDVPLSFNLEDAELADYDTEVVREIFVELGFRTLMKKIPNSNEKLKIKNEKLNEPLVTGQVSMFGGRELGDGNDKQSEDTRIQDTNKFQNSKLKNKYKVVKTVNEVEEFIELLGEQKIFAYDTETTGLNFMDVDVLGISFSWNEGEGYYLDLESSDFTEKHISSLKRIFEDPEIKKIGHNLKYDVHVLNNKTHSGLDLNIRVQNQYFDTLIAAYVLNGGSRGIGLKELAFNKFGVVMTELDEVWKTVDGFKEKKKYTTDEVEKYMVKCDKDLLGYYAAADADITWRLFNLQKEELKDKKLEDLFYNIEMPVVQVLMDMERDGVSLDVDYLVKFGQDLDKQIRGLEDSIYEYVGHEFNIASPKQVGEVLFDELGLPGGKKTKTGAWQTNERILQDLKEASPVVSNLLEYRELSKLRSTYIDSLIEQVDINTQRVHTSYNQTVASTGRLSSSGPNLQNIPVSSEVGIKIRKAFIPKSGYKFAAFDISQQELRILAHLSGEKNLVDAYKNDVDVHALTASKIFEVDLNDVTKEQRAKGKTLNFSLIYGISAYGLSARLKIPREEGQQLIDSYFEVYPKVREFFDKLLVDAKEEGKVETMFGRYRDTSGLGSSNFQLRAATEREVINFPIQGTAADMVKIAMKNCADYIQNYELAKELDVKMILQVHDELIFEIKHDGVDDFEGKYKKFSEAIQKIMEESVKLSVPIKVGANMGNDWGDLK